MFFLKFDFSNIYTTLQDDMFESISVQLKYLLTIKDKSIATLLDQYFLKHCFLFKISFFYLIIY